MEQAIFSNSTAAMEVARRISLWLVLASVPALVWGAPRTCQLEGAKCTYAKLNLSSDGLLRLRESAGALQDVYLVQVDRLITPYADGVLLQLLGEFVREVAYVTYRERFLRIPPDCGLTEIQLKSAPQLQTIAVAAPNAQLVGLDLSNVGLRSLPDSFLNLRKLQYLTIDDSALQSVSLEPLSRANISTLMLDHNNVTELVASSDPTLVVPAGTLSLAYNLLESFDGAFFRPLTKLTYLSLEGNRLQRLEGQPVDFPRLVYLHLDRNQMTQLDASGWRAPRLEQLFLEYNNLTRVPAGLERLPKLSSLLLANNQLASVDFRRLQGWPSLNRIDLSSNALQSVRVSQPGRVSLPLVEAINLAFNRLAQIDFARWDAPVMTNLVLAANQLDRLPDLFQLFPRLLRVIAFQNPFRCANLRQLQVQLTQNRLSVATTAYGMPCETNSSFTLPTGRVICCMQYE